MEDFNIGYIF